jgi:glutathione S-transferase
MTRPRPHAPELTLVIGDKRKSSWSLRPWLALAATGYPFRERKILLDRPTSRAELDAASPTGKVPVLLDGDLAIYESLAICETLAEWFPAARLWPDDPGARALARSVATEMHGGFPNLRRELSMDLALRTQLRPSPAAQAEIDRICAVWRGCRSRAAAEGDMLFGTWSIADCMYAPVATRFRSYGVPLDPVCAAYVEAVLERPAMRAWTADALLEAQAAS